MEIKLKKEEKCKIVYDECPCCHKTFNSRARKITEHHVVPKFLDPKTEITVTICKDCHEKLNGHYDNGAIMETFTKNKKGLTSKPTSFEDFLKNYKTLRHDFNSKKLDRGKFGEGLWTNLVNYLEFINTTMSTGYIPASE